MLVFFGLERGKQRFNVRRVFLVDDGQHVCFQANQRFMNQYFALIWTRELRSISFTGTHSFDELNVHVRLLFVFL